MDEKKLAAQTEEKVEEVVELADEQLEDATGGVIIWSVGAYRPDQYCPNCKSETVLRCDQATHVVEKIWGTLKYETGWYCTKCWHRQVRITYGQAGE